MLLILLTPTLLFAEEYNSSITVGLYTHHYVDGEYTEGIDNKLIAIEHKGWNFADFVNSHGNETQFFGYGWHTKKIESEDADDWWVRGNIYLGVLVGYGDHHPIHLGAISPGLYPTGSIGYKRYSLEVGVMPGFVWSGVKIEF